MEHRNQLNFLQYFYDNLMFRSRNYKLIEFFINLFLMQSSGSVKMRDIVYISFQINIYMRNDLCNWCIFCGSILFYSYVFVN